MPEWNVSIPKDTDRLVRVLLARSERGAGDLSAFVNEAVREKAIAQLAARLREENPQASDAELKDALASIIRRESIGELLDELRAQHADADPGALQAEIDEAVAWVRARPA